MEEFIKKKLYKKDKAGKQDTIEWVYQNSEHRYGPSSVNGEGYFKYNYAEQQTCKCAKIMVFVNI